MKLPNILFRSTVIPGYFPDLDCIIIPPLEAFSSQERFYHILFHELAHSTGTKTRLDRHVEKAPNKEERAFEEIVAEMTAIKLLKDFKMLKKEEEEEGNKYISEWFKIIGATEALHKASVESLRAYEYLKEAFKGMEKKKSNERCQKRLPVREAERL